MPRALVSEHIELQYRDSGGDGEPLLLIMGIGAQMVHWPPGFIEHLIARGYRVIAFDNRDVGLSTKLEGAAVMGFKQLVTKRLLGRRIDVAYDLLDMADDVAGLLDVLQLPQAHIVGVSMGGMIAQTFAIAHPQRIASLTSIMSHTGALRYMVSHPSALASLMQRAPRNRDEAIANAVAFYKAVGSTGFERDFAAVRERAGKGYDRCFYPRGFLRQLAAIVASGSREQALRFVRVPTMVIHGTVDPLIRAAGGRATAEAIRNADLCLIDGMGHDLPRGAWPTIGDAIARVTSKATARRAAPAITKNVHRHDLN